MRREGRVTAHINHARLEDVNDVFSALKAGRVDGRMVLDIGLPDDAAGSLWMSHSADRSRAPPRAPMTWPSPHADTLGSHRRAGVTYGVVDRWQRKRGWRSEWNRTQVVESEPRRARRVTQRAPGVVNSPLAMRGMSLNGKGGPTCSSPPTANARPHESALTVTERLGSLAIRPRRVAVEHHLEIIGARL